MSSRKRPTGLGPCFHVKNYTKVLNIFLPVVLLLVKTAVSSSYILLEDLHKASLYDQDIRTRIVHQGYTGRQTSLRIKKNEKCCQKQGIFIIRYVSETIYHV